MFNSEKFDRNVEGINTVFSFTYLDVKLASIYNYFEGKLYFCLHLCVITFILFMKKEVFF